MSSVHIHQIVICAPLLGDVYIAHAEFCIDRVVRKVKLVLEDPINKGISLDIKSQLPIEIADAVFNLISIGDSNPSDSN